MKWIGYLKSKWHIDNDRDFWLIMLTFSLAGSTILFVRKLFFPLFGISDHTSMWIKIAIYIPMAFCFYQVGLLLWGTILGQFKFFWAYEKRMILFLLGRSKNVKH